MKGKASICYCVLNISEGIIEGESHFLFSRNFQKSLKLQSFAFTLIYGAFRWEKYPVHET